ncbi:MAG: hypothetical protein IPG44_07340 [Anaerolineales bacterium]|jgi:hypothetical protein|nr:hypothetical protein [Anaerolineales bacterium]MCC6986978.1 hypothetical protein [Anaerolineales bacterium]
MAYPLSRLGVLVKAAPEKDADGYLRETKKTGMIEKDLGTGDYAVMLFAGGTPVSAYILKDGGAKTLSTSEFTAFPSKSAGEVRVIDLSDVAGRLARLAFESRQVARAAIQDAEDWRRHIERWQRENWSGLVEVSSPGLYGMALFWRGGAQKADMIFSNEGGILTETFGFESPNGFPWEVSAFAFDESDPAYQCAALRYAVVDWTNMILARYQELVGHKLLETLEQELNRQIQPWEWKIALGRAAITDSHFFIHPKDAETAYRALFMSMGMLMDIVIGSALTRRLLKETFDLLNPADIRLLTSLRLIPAAFSE